VTLDVTLVKIGTNPRTSLPTVASDAMTTLKRSDFGLGKYVPQVGDDVQMHIIIQAVEAKSYAQYLKAQEAAELRKPQRPKARRRSRRSRHGVGARFLRSSGSLRPRADLASNTPINASVKPTNCTGDSVSLNRR